jgi:hypothetical protein
MTRQLLVFCAALALLPAVARASDYRATSRARSGPLIIAVPELAQAGAAAPQTEQEPASPTTAPPEELPPPGPSDVSPPSSSEPRSSTSSAPDGRWVYTPEYGWIWVPYADAYTHEPPPGYGAPSVYVYYPYYGWTWVVAPWVSYWRPWPYAGFHASWHFGWYGHRGWRDRRWHDWPAPHRGGWPSHGVVRPAPRPGVGPVPRSSPGSVPPRGIGAPAPHRSGDGAPVPHVGRPRPR